MSGSSPTLEAILAPYDDAKAVAVAQLLRDVPEEGGLVTRDELTRLVQAAFEGGVLTAVFDEGEAS
jgi:hypothetical protein